MVLLPPLCEKYLRDMIIHMNRRPKTREAYALELTLWATFLSEHIKGRDVLTANSEDVEAYMEYCALVKKNGVATRRRKLSCLRAFYKWAVKKQHLSFSPAHAVDLPQAEEAKAIYLDDREVKQLLEIVVKEPTKKQQAAAWARTWRRDRAMIYLMLFNGMRMGEVVALSWGDVDVDRREIRAHGKSRHERPLMAHSLSLKVLRDLRQFGPTSENGPIFVTTENPNPNVPAGERLSDWSARRAVHKYIDAVITANKSRLDQGLRRRVTTHKLRHTFATRLLDNGVDIRDIAEHLGHKSLAATRIYTHPKSDRLRAQIDAVSFSE